MAEIEATTAELFAENQRLQESQAVRLLAATNLAAYVTLMERHLDHTAKITESELVARLDKDLDTVGLDDLTALTLIKRCTALQSSGRQA